MIECANKMTIKITKTTNKVERMFTVALSTSDSNNLVGNVNTVVVVVADNVGVVLGFGLLVMALKIIIYFQLKANNNMKQS